MVARASRISGRAPIVTLISCEHGGNAIPAAYRALFAGHDEVLASHRGFDPGALALARDLAAACKAPLIAATTSRLLVELNRSRHHPMLFSEFTRGLPRETRERIVARYYAPYRHRVEAHVRAAIAAGSRVVHLSAHSFTPVLDMQTRNADVGLLYDPRRPWERRFCEHWSERLAQRIAPLRVRRNYPYRGYDDGLTTTLRSRFPQSAYVGIEIEVNQKHALNGGSGWRRLRAQIVQTAVEMVEQHAGPASRPFRRRPGNARMEQAV